MHRLLIFAICSGALIAQDGATIYKNRCAQCHDHPIGRVPTLSALRAMTSAAILNALDNGAMKTQAAGLSEAERRAIAEYLSHPAETMSPATSNACPASAP